MKWLAPLTLFLSFQVGFATEREVTVVNPQAGVSLEGTLTLPEGRPRAALVLATGSGTQNRDEEILGHKPFKAIAEYLGNAGYAVLRLDDRGIGGSSGNSASTTTADYAADLSYAVAALDSLIGQSVPKGALGHSEGASAVTMLASRQPLCSFIVTLAAPAWPGDSIVMSQGRAAAVAATGVWEAEAHQRRIMDLVKSDLSDIMLRPLLYSAVADAYGDAAKLTSVQAQLSQVVRDMCTPSYRYIVKYDPTEAITAVEVPWLALQGDRDMQVLPENIATVERLNPQARCVVLAGHNHLFQECTTGSPAEYAHINQDISPETLEAIRRFLDALDL